MQNCKLWSVGIKKISKNFFLFLKVGKSITLFKKNGAGQIVKACNQMQVAKNFVGMAEAFVLGIWAGADPAIIVKVLSGRYV